MASERAELSPTPSVDHHHNYSDVSFEPPPDRKYHCPVCLSVMKNPVQTKCGHRFCQACILRISGQRQYVKCPVDNTWFYVNGDMFDDVAIKREILSLTCLCYNHSNGCQWKKELFYLRDHIDSCDYTIIVCPNGCKQEYLRQESSTHLQDCPLRTVQCSQCCEDVVAKDLTRHQLLLCPKLPVRCVFCGRNGILRDEIAIHVSKEGSCPNTLMPCHYYELGCTSKVRRCELAVHVQNNMAEHLALMAEKILMQQNIIDQQNKELELRKIAEENNARVFMQKLEDFSKRLDQIENKNPQGTNTEAS